MTVARLAVQPTPSRAMRTTNTDSIDPKASLRLSSSNNNDKGKGSPTFLTSTTSTSTSSSATNTTVQPPPPSSSEQQQRQQQQPQPLPLFTPIWDYDRFPVGPCVRENRSSQEHENPFLMMEYHQHHRPQSNRPSPSGTAVMIRTSSSSSSSSTASLPTEAAHTRPHGRNHGGSNSNSSSRRGSRNLSIKVLGKSTSFPSSTTTTGMNMHGISDFSGAPPSPSLLAADPSSSFSLAALPAGGMALHTSTDLYGDLADRNDDNIDQETNNNNNAKATTATATVQPTSKFDLYKAQMDRVRSSHRLHGRSASASTSFPTTTTANVGEGISGGGQLPFPSTPSSSCSPPTSPTIYTSSSSSAASFAPSKKSSHGGLFPKKLFKKPSLSNNKSKSRGTQSPTSGGAGVSRSSLLVNEKQQTVDPSHRHSVSLSRSVSRSADHPTTSSPTTPQQQRSPIEEQQDRWREEWLRPSGAIHSMFRDGPSKFNCPHCGAIKVVSNIQFVPGLMSYLVAFGLMFLTLGTLSYLPFRKDHEGTKDCIHWCPECERKVARFNRANSTWEWI